MITCKFCNSKQLKKILNLGSTPLANSYVVKYQDFKFEKSYPLELHLCKKCKLIQAPHNISPNKIFVNYDYLSGISSTWTRHCNEFFKKITKKFKYKSKKDTIVEIASNDGTLLKFFKKKKFNCIGVEPSKYAANIAKKNKIYTINKFLTPQLANKIKKKNKNISLIVANNVIAHVLNINSFIKSLSLLCRESTTLTIEFPHVGNLFKKLQYDTIYHEHHYYYSLESIQNLLAKYNLYIFDVEKIKIHGGSFRIYVRKSNKSVTKSKRLLTEIKKELEMNLYSFKSLKKLNSDVKKTKINAIKYLKRLKSSNVKISAYGAAAKGNTFLNYCKMNSETIDYVYDNNKLKQNKFLPGSRIKILDPKMIKKNKPDYIIILPWNIKEEIIKTYNFAKTWGCKFLVLLPKIKKY
jgi:hypothetical protein